jgi:hypothetical protein
MKTQTQVRIKYKEEHENKKILVGSMGFLIDMILPPHYDPGVNRASKRNEHQGSSLVGKGDRCFELTILPPSCAGFLRILGASTSWTPMGVSRLAQGQHIVIY